MQESLGFSNSGSAGTLEAFLRWAVDECPARNYVLVFGGHGILEGPDDVLCARHTFAICNDYTAGDALDLYELSSTLRRVFSTDGPRRLRLLAFDMAAVQFLEVCYELRDVASVLVAEQPQSGGDTSRRPWDYHALLGRWSLAVVRGGTHDHVATTRHLAREAVAVAGARPGSGTWSAVALDALEPIVEPFDTFSAVMFQWLSSDVVWAGRELTFNRLAPARGADTPSVYSYDFAQLGRVNASSMREAIRRAVPDWSAATWKRLTTKRQFELTGAMLEAIRAEGGGAGSFQNVSVQCERLRQQVRMLTMARAGQAAAQAQPSEEAFRRMVDTPLGVRSHERWHAIWARALTRVGEPLKSEHDYVLAGQRAAERLAVLADAVADTFQHGPDSPVLARSGKAEFCGLALFRPFDLENLSDASYLELAFSKNLNWTSLLTAVYLVKKHPRTLWRLLESQLTAAPTSARYGLLERLAGQTAVTGRFAAQLKSLAPPPATLLTVETIQSAGEQTGSASPASPADSVQICVRVTELSTTVARERVHSMKRERLDTVLKRLLDVTAKPYDDVRRTAAVLEECGRVLGEDLLEGVTIAALNPSEPRRPHLILQVPSTWMPYPWELLVYERQPLWRQFAVGRQVQSDVATRVGAEPRHAARIRVLVVNPRLGEPWSAVGAREGKGVTQCLKAFNSRLAGLVDVTSRVDEDVTVGQFREWLREGYDVVHLATHGRYDNEHPRFSSWQFTDGPLYSYELRNSLASAETMPWLMVANACESAGAPSSKPGSHRGLHGLAAAAISQGVSAFIAPLWEIDDHDATDFASAFYHALLVDRWSVGESLLHARMALTSGRGCQPASRRAISAAGLTLYGDPTPTILQRFTPAHVSQGSDTRP